MTADILENHSFILQDAVQKVHWNNSQATLYSFAWADLEKILGGASQA